MLIELHSLPLAMIDIMDLLVHVLSVSAGRHNAPVWLTGGIMHGAHVNTVLHCMFHMQW